MLKLSLILLFLHFQTNIFAQFDSLGLNTKWNKGSIILNDDSKLKGFIKVNDKMGLIKFKETPNDTEELSFPERRILSMEFFDTDISGYRKFTTFNVKDDKIGFKGAVLLEIIMELKRFAMLSKILSVSPAIRQRSNNYQTYSVKVGYEQSVQLYLVGDDGEIDLLLNSVALEKDKLHPFASKEKPFLNTKLLMKHMGDKWPKVKIFTKENRLDLKSRNGLMNAFDYYYGLEQAE